MRIFERMQLAAALFLLSTKACHSDSFYQALMHDGLGLLLIVGPTIEGIRITQLPLMLSFLISIFWNLADKLEDLRFIAAGFIVSLGLLIVFGECNYSRLKTTGPYEVGFKEFHSSELSNECAVYYPCAAGEIGSKLNVEVKFMPHGET